jgi:hypothetical protein
VENVAEELAAVAQELLVQDPFCVFLTDIDVDHVMRQKPILSSVSGCGFHEALFGLKRTH